MRNYIVWTINMIASIIIWYNIVYTLHLIPYHHVILSISNVMISPTRTSSRRSAESPAPSSGTSGVDTRCMSRERRKGPTAGSPKMQATRCYRGTTRDWFRQPSLAPVLDTWTLFTITAERVHGILYLHAPPSLDDALVVWIITTCYVSRSDVLLCEARLGQAMTSHAMISNDIASHHIACHAANPRTKNQ